MTKVPKDFLHKTSEFNIAKNINFWEKDYYKKYKML